MHAEDMDSENQLCVKWDNHHGTLVSVLETLYNDETYVDCTLATEGQELSAHKVVLSACSPFLNKLLKKHYDKHPIIVLRDVSFMELQYLIEYMYKGEVSVAHEQLASFLKAAETLQIAGLSGTSPDYSFINFEKGLQSDSKQGSDDESDDNDLPPSKRIKAENKVAQLLQEDDGDETEYLTDDDTVMEPIKVKSEGGSFQVYLVDNEYASIKELEAAHGDNAETVDEGMTLEVMGNIFEDDTDVLDKGQIGKGKILPEKIQMATTTPKIKPRTVIHRDDYNISCTKCGGLYKHESSFLNHLRHDCNQVHSCSSCNKSFKNKRHLLDHVRDDCGRVHMCPRCSKYFKQKVNLTTHMKHYCKPDKSGRIERLLLDSKSADQGI